MGGRVGGGQAVVPVQQANTVGDVFHQAPQFFFALQEGFVHALPVGHFLLKLCVGPSEGSGSFFDIVRHQVERPGKLAQFVTGRKGYALIKVSGSQLLGGLSEFPDGSAHPLREPEAEQQGFEMELRSFFLFFLSIK